MEYRALGMPIISSDVLSHQDYVEEDINGMLIPNTEDAWAAAMLRFVQDRDFLDECYRQALAMRKANTIVDVARMHEAVYQRLRNNRV
jgi:glycosyltransferase involved in cell wall biosynthesis